MPATRAMLDSEAIKQGILHQLKQSGIHNLAEVSITKNTNQWSMISNDGLIVAPHHKHAALLQGPRNGGGLPFDGRISSLSSIAKPTASED